MQRIQPILHPNVSLSSAEESIEPEGTVTLTATYSPNNAVVTWTSSDETVATVEGGVVTGVSEGSATITATATYGGKTATATCVVTVAAG